MTDEELKKLAQEYNEGLKQVEEVKAEYNKKFENLNEEEFKKAFLKQLEEVASSAQNHNVKIKPVTKNKQ